MIIGIVLEATAASSKGRKLGISARKAWFLLVLFIVLTVNFYESRALQSTIAWLSGIVLFLMIVDLLISQGKRMNQKLVTGFMIIVVVVGGILANVCVFFVPTSFGARTFSLAVLTFMITPLTFALIAHLKGKKELSKKLVNFVCLGVMKN